MLYDFGLYDSVFSGMSSEMILTVFGLQIPVFLWMLFGLKRFFAYSWTGSAIRSALMAWLLLLPIFGFRFLSFIVVLWTV